MSISIFNTLKNYHQYLTEKYALHASNLAKSDVPGAKGETLEAFHDVFQRTLNRGKKVSAYTHPRHMAFKGEDSNFRSIPYKKISTSYSGNNIDPKAEMHAINNVAHEHKKVTNLYRKLTAIWHKNVEV